MGSKKRIRVVAAEIERDERFLITQRREEAVFPLLWEFPSGRVEDGEEDCDALQRELKERLGIDGAVGEEVLAVEREYESYTIDFHVYRCELRSEELEPLRVKDFRWVAVPEMADYDFPPADQESVDLLLHEG